MEVQNQSSWMHFTFIGLMDRPGQEAVLFTLFLTMYVVGLVSNSAIITAITCESQLHSPMYFFIWNLSLVDISVMTIVVPQLLVNSISERKTISFPRCITQLYIFAAVGSTNILLLSVMAYDRYAAICKPLHYLTVMNKKVCNQLVAGSWVVALLNSLMHSIMISRLSFCASNLIQSFFCDIPGLLNLSCSDTSTTELLLLLRGLFTIPVSILFIVISYSCIVITTLSIQSNKGRWKVFSTCSSHLIVVSLHYATLLFSYARPTHSFSMERHKVVSVMYTTVTPMMNPFIYSLRNDQMKGALKKVLARCIYSGKF